MHDHKLGETVLVTVDFKDKDGAAMAATGVTVTARRPDGTIVAGGVTPGDAVGRFSASFIGDAPGRWLVKAECAGPAVVRDESTLVISRLRFDTA